MVMAAPHGVTSHVRPWTGADIRAIRARARMTQLQFATAVGVKPVAVSRWENNHARPHPVFMEAILELAGAKPKG